jgi:hypothetical protein
MEMAGRIYLESNESEESKVIREDMEFMESYESLTDCPSFPDRR